MNTGPGIAGPLELFATWVHEASHAVVGLLCGASITRIDLSTDGSGVTGVRTGFPPSDFTQVAVGSAGYVGTVIIGALLLAAGRWVTASRAALSVIGGFMVLSALLWMPSAFSFGLSVGLGALFVVLVFLVPPRWIRFLVTGLGALTVVEGLLRIADVGDRTPDAVQTSHFGDLGVGTVRVLWLLVAAAAAVGAIVVRTKPFRDAANKQADSVSPPRPDGLSGDAPA